MGRFEVALSRELFKADGHPTFDARLLDILDQEPAIHWRVLPEPIAAVTPAMAGDFDALYLASERVGADVTVAPDRRLRLVARHGVGFDSVDVAAMSAGGVLVTNTPLAVRRPVATMALTLVLALAQKLLVKHHLTRASRWHERVNHMGRGLTGKTLGIIGAGSIGRELLRLVAPFEMRCLAADPHAERAAVTAAGAELVELDTLLAQADFVVVAALLTEETRHLVDAAALARMKPDAYLVNVARGPIVDEPALIDALRAGSLAGAALDVFEREPVDADNPLLAMENVITTPHALCWTDECFDNIARTGLGSICDFAHRRVPEFVVDRRALAHPRLVAWFEGE